MRYRPGRRPPRAIRRPGVRLVRVSPPPRRNRRRVPEVAPRASRAGLAAGVAGRAGQLAGELAPTPSGAGLVLAPTASGRRPVAGAAGSAARPDQRLARLATISRIATSSA